MVEDRINKMEKMVENRIEKCLKDPKYSFCKNKSFLKWNEKRGNKEFYTGKILHLDGDKRYTEKSMRYYKSLGLNAVVKNVPENKQPYVIKMLLDRYQPDILVITGHERIY